MTVSEQMTPAAEFTELWQAVMPGTPSPGADQFMLWAGNFTEAQVCWCIDEAARKPLAMMNISHPMTLDESGSIRQLDHD